MVTTVERLRVVYELDDRQARAGFENMRRSSRAAHGDIVAGANRASRSMGGIRTSALAAAAALGTLAVGMNQFRRAADDFITIENRLRSIGQAGDEAAGKLLRSAMRSRTELMGYSTAVARIQKATNAEFDVTIRRVETLTKLLAIGGATGAERSSVMTQLSQALTSGTLQGDELRSLREAAPVEVLDAIAKQAGVTRGELKKLGEEGRLTSDIVIRALDSLAGVADGRIDDAVMTSADAFTNLGSAATVFFGRLDEGLGISEGFVDILESISGWLADNAENAEDFGAAFVAAMNDARDALDRLTQGMAEFGNSDFFAALNEAMGVTENGQIVNPDVREAEDKIYNLEKQIETLQAQIENQTNLGFDASDAIAELGRFRAELAAAKAEAASLPRYVDGIKPNGEVVYDNLDSGTFLDSYDPPPAPPEPLPPIVVPSAPPPTSGRRSGGGGRKSGGGGGRAERPFYEDVEKDQLRLEREISLLGKSTQAVAAAEAEWAMLDEAKKRGLEVSDVMAARIKSEAEQVGLLTAELERGEIAHERFEAAVEGIADAMAGALVAGESLREGLAQVFKQIARDILASGIRDALMSQFQASGGGGGFSIGSIFRGLGSLFGGFRASGGPVSANRAYVVGEQGPEIIVPDRNSMVIPNHAIRGGDSGAQDVNVTVSVDENGNLQAFVDKRAGRVTRQGIATYDKAMPARVQQINNKPWSR